MSVLAASNIMPANLPSELNLNPVWEEWRSYFLAGSFVCSLLPFYLTLNGVDLHCLPSYSNISENISSNCTYSANRILSISQTDYVNSQCAADEKLWLQRYASAIMLGITSWIQVVSWVWLNFKNVIDGIKTFSQRGEKLLRLVLSLEEIEALCTKRLPAEDSNNVVFEYMLQDDGYEEKTHKEVREFLRFCAFEPPRYFLYHHLVRNILTFIVLCVATILTLYGVGVATTSDSWRKNITCRFNDTSDMSLEEFICTNNSAMTITAFLVVYGGTLFYRLY